MLYIVHRRHVSTLIGTYFYDIGHMLNTYSRHLVTPTTYQCDQKKIAKCL